MTSRLPWWRGRKQGSEEERLAAYLANPTPKKPVKKRVPPPAVQFLKRESWSTDDPAQLRRLKNRKAGIGLIITGLLLTPGYILLSTFMMMMGVSRVEVVGVGILSVICVVGGIVVLFRRR